jgi:tetratricopeptide (TPR) repeat protein
MNGIPQPAPSSNHSISRELLLTLLNTAIRTGELRYARRLCTSWLAIYPGDLQVNLLYAHAFFRDKSSALQLHALPIAEELCKLDPEFLEAQELLAEVSQLAGTTNHLVAKACANALAHDHTVKTGKNGYVSSWSKYLFEARTALSNVRKGDYQQFDKAEYYIHKALIENPDTPLAAVIHLRLIESNGSIPKPAVRNLAQIYHEHWPDCLQFLLTLSNQLMESGESSQAVDMLHQAVSKDIAGQVAKRMWGDHHQYSSMWPVTLEANNTSQNSPQNIPIPAAVASSLGWNQIPAVISDSNVPGTVTNNPNSGGSAYYTVEVPQSKPVYASHTTLSEDAQHTISEPARIVQNKLEKLADELKRPHLAHEDGRFPTYVVFTTRGGLKAQYDTAIIQDIDSALKKLVEVIRGYKINQELWGSMLFYADDAVCTQPYGLQPAAYNDAWQLKLIIADLDAALGKRGERIGALLIVGGPEIIPFHNLPNPVEDADADVPSDNPYAAKDNNYFISDWPVGRVSGGSSRDPSTLLSLLKEITNRYDKKAKRSTWYVRLIKYIRGLIKTGLSKKLSSFGYTAAVWRRASLSVFRSIGNPDDLLISPPIHASDAPGSTCTDNISMSNNSRASSCLNLPDTHLAYFNLHGVPDASEWYGQCDPTQPEAGPEFPVAMRPEDIRNSGSAPRLVFTEACYGANIAGKSVDEAISLKFLASGTHAVVGSTCISYGSLSTPLSSADLLGRVFWNLLQEGFTAGESLRRAKIHLTREMNQRQGFLDAEDQKTLISFVLFGDPLALPFQTKVTPKITPHLSDAAIQVPTVCERSCDGEDGSTVSLETISHLKSIVAKYLPGMDDAKVSLSHEHQTCSNLCGNCGSGKKCAFSEAHSKNHGTITSQRRVVTLSKNFEQAQHMHKQYARLTLDERGNIIKMVVSH